MATELLKLESKLTQEIHGHESNLSSEIDMFCEANRRILDKYLRKDMIYLTYLRTHRSLQADLEHLRVFLLPSLTSEEDRLLCDQELHHSQALLAKATAEVDEQLPLKVVKMARSDDVTRALADEAVKVKQLRGDLEGVRGEEEAESDEGAEERVEAIIRAEELAEEVRSKMIEVEEKLKEAALIQGND